MKNKNILTYENSWEFDSYFVDGKRIEDLTKIKIGKKTYDVISEKITVYYNDMGSRSGSTSTHFFVKEKIFGYERRFDLNEFASHIKITAIKFKLQGDK